MPRPLLPRCLAAPLLVAALLCACRRPPAGPPAADAGPATREVTDTMGRTLRLPVDVRRVISLAPSSTEILYAIGAGPLLVGADRYSDHPPAVAAVEKVGADIDPSLERIVGLRPDVILAAASANAQRTVEALDRLGLPVYVSRSRTVEDCLADVDRIAAVVGRASEGARVRRGLEERIARVRQRVAGRPKVKTLVVVWPEPLVVAGGGTHVDELIDLAGGDNLAHASPHTYPQYSLERLLVQAPEVLIVGTHTDANKGIPPAFANLTTLPAVKRGRVHSLDGDLIFRPGPRVVDGLEALAALLHPAAFAAPGDGGAP